MAVEPADVTSMFGASHGADSVSSHPMQLYSGMDLDMLLEPDASNSIETAVTTMAYSDASPSTTATPPDYSHGYPTEAIDGHQYSTPRT